MPRPAPPPEILRRVRTRVAEAIDRRGIPLARLARRAGVSKNTVRALLSPDVADMNLGTLCAVCRELELEVDRVLAPLPDELAADPDPAGPADPG